MVVGLLLVGSLVAHDADAGGAKDDVAPDGTAAAVAARLEVQVRGVVPKGWSVRVSGPRIVASRDVLVTEEANASPEPEGRRPTRSSYEIALVVGPHMTQAELDALRRKNQALGAALARQERKMKAFACDDLDSAYEDDCYRPRTRAERALVDKLKALRAKWLVLPDYHVEDLVSVTLRVDGAQWDEHLECDDCARVKASIVTLLNPYRAATAP
jgi:hypothetical protein